jgi:hypothetical protein
MPKSETSTKHEIKEGKWWRTPHAKEKLRSMEQCFCVKAGKHRVLARKSFRDCSTQQARGGNRPERSSRNWKARMNANERK